MKLNKKGYMLVEIILASALAFGLAFFIIDLVIRLKNKNDDLLVENLITTDKTIITNKLMSYAKLETKNFDCNKLTITGNTVKYKDEVIDIITDYANVGELSCSTVGGKVSITIPISVPQMPNKDYDITFDYKYEIGDMVPPACSLSVSGTTITGSYSDSGGSGVAYYGWNSSMTGTSSATKTINSTGTYTFYVKDVAGNSKSCSLSVINTNYKDEYTETDPSITYSGSCYCCKGQGGTTVGRYVSCNSYGTCSCPPGSSICQRGCKAIYYCSSDASLSEGKCYKKTGVSYNCTAGYTKASNDYCYKINK